MSCHLNLYTNSMLHIRFSQQNNQSTGRVLQANWFYQADGVYHTAGWMWKENLKRRQRKAFQSIPKQGAHELDIRFVFVDIGFVIRWKVPSLVKRLPTQLKPRRSMITPAFWIWCDDQVHDLQLSEAAYDGINLSSEWMSPYIIAVLDKARMSMNQYCMHGISIVFNIGMLRRLCALNCRVYFLIHNKF